MFTAKRLFDLVFAAIGLFILLPILSLVVFLIRINMGSPVIFGQIRPGLDGRLFKMYKFRTMTNSCDGSGRLLSDEKRLTRLGKFLRASSLDEIPELFNVLKGDMSLVGPRPLLPEYLPLYNAEQRRRHEVRPGITGWAQVNGRNALSWEDKFQLDTWYVDNWTLWLDIQILWITLIKVFKREGISQEGHATATKFLGSNSGRK